VVKATVLDNPFVPDPVKAKLTTKQAEFLADTSLDVFYGGAGGGGKSYALLLSAAQLVTEPGYHALILRRTHKQLAKADSILGLAKAWWFNRPDVRYWAGDHTFAFPSGATIEFGHMDTVDAKYNYQGATYQYVGYDELTQFVEEMHGYLFSRIRRPATSRLWLRMRGAGNPGGIGHQWVKKRYIDPRTRVATSRFIPARLADNPNIDQHTYVQSLTEADPLTRAQILRGDWDAVEGGRFRREWFRYYRPDPSAPGSGYVLTDNGERFRIQDRPLFQTCDPAASTSNAADHFVLCTWCLTPRADLLWVGCHRGKYEIPEQVRECQRLYRRWRPQFLAVEEVLNQRALAQLLRRSDDPAMAIRGVSPLGRDKLARSTGATNLAHSGRVLLPEADPGFPLDEVIAELCMFTGEPGAPDDIADTLFYAAELLPHLAPLSGPGAAPSAHPSPDPFRRGDGPGRPGRR
jgi:phage terminase large subunit-like protein